MGPVPTCWTDAMPQQKEEWFNIFRKSFDWPSGLEHVVRDRYNAICTKIYRDLIYKTVRRKKEPEHLKGDAYQGLMKKRATPEFKIKSERGSLNERGGKKEGIIEATHYGGSRSFLDRVLGKGKKKGKVEMTAPEFFVDMHSKVDDKGNRHWTKAKDKELHDAYLRDKENTPNRPDNDIWFDLVEGYKKGSVYETGEAHGVF
ncbi:uncharacterized protein LOC141632953 [Silene latifolia]|uniref:uncharacterized protein LOC141632953 n=1 Tax=Silene latifolia TaxID=37657 RepID=UPI003D77ABE6